MNIVNKVTGDSLTANEFNQIPDELENVITSAGLSPDDQNLSQVASSIAQYANDGNFYTTSGTANAIILSSNTQRSSAKNLTNGFKVRFFAGYNNTGATTINVANFGTKDLQYRQKSLLADFLVAGNLYEATYNSSTDAFELVYFDVNNFAKIYNSVSELKNDNTLEAGMFCKTTGYYTDNDGGEAEYLIRQATPSDVDDGGSILSISGGTLVAELLLKNGKVNVKQFGAKIDNINDDSTAFNNACNFLSTTSIHWTQWMLYYTGGELFVPHGIMKINSTLTIDVSKFSVIFDGTIINAENITDIAINVVGYNYPPFGQAKRFIQGFDLIGNNVGTGLQLGLFTDTPKRSEQSRIQIRNFRIAKFADGITFGNHTYLIHFENGEIQDCGNGVYYPNTLTDSGENIMFYGCVFFGGRLLNINGSNTTLRFVTCSFDYCTQILKATGTNFCSFVDCHFEWSNTETVAFQFDQGFHLSFRGGLMMNTSQEPKTSECVFEVLNTTTSYVTSGYKITIDNMLLSLPKFKYLIKNDNILVKNTLSWGFVNLPRYQDNLSSNIKGNCNIDTALTTSYANNQLTIQRVHRGQISFTFISKLTKDTNFSVYHTELVTPEQILLPIWRTVGICTFDRDGKIVILYSQGSTNITPTIQTAIQDSQPTVNIGDILYCKNLSSWINQYGDNIYHFERYVTSDGEYLFNFVFNNILFENY